MRTFQTIVLLAIMSCVGCHTAANTPSAALAPGYSSPADQQIGQALAAIDAFVSTESTVNYPKLNAAQQAQEKAPLNALIAAANAANAAYTGYHAGTQTLQQVQGALAAAQQAQAVLVSAKGVK